MGGRGSDEEEDDAILDFSSVAEGAEEVYAASIDYDGCGQVIYDKRDQESGKLHTENKLATYILGESEQYSVTEVIVGSNRQCYAGNLENCVGKDNGDCYDVYDKFCQQNQLEFNPFLVADILANEDPGSSRNESMPKELKEALDAYNEDGSEENKRHLYQLFSLWHGITSVHIPQLIKNFLIKENDDRAAGLKSDANNSFPDYIKTFRQNFKDKDLPKELVESLDKLKQHEYKLRNTPTEDIEQFQSAYNDWIESYKNEHQEISKSAPKKTIDDESKIITLIAQAHMLALKYPDKKITLDFIDDRDGDILPGLIDTLGSNPYCLPSNVNLRLHSYSCSDGKKPHRLCEIQGRGPRFKSQEQVYNYIHSFPSNSDDSTLTRKHAIKMDLVFRLLENEKIEKKQFEKILKDPNKFLKEKINNPLESTQDYLLKAICDGKSKGIIDKLSIIRKFENSISVDENKLSKLIFDQAGSTEEVDTLVLKKIHLRIKNETNIENRLKLIDLYVQYVLASNPKYGLETLNTYRYIRSKYPEYLTQAMDEPEQFQSHMEGILKTNYEIITGFAGSDREELAESLYQSENERTQFCSDLLANAKVNTKPRICAKFIGSSSTELDELGLTAYQSLDKAAVEKLIKDNDGNPNQSIIKAYLIDRAFFNGTENTIEELELKAQLFDKVVRHHQTESNPFQALLDFLLAIATVFNFKDFTQSLLEKGANPFASQGILGNKSVIGHLATSKKYDDIRFILEQHTGDQHAQSPEQNPDSATHASSISLRSRLNSLNQQQANLKQEEPEGENTALAEEASHCSTKDPTTRPILPTPTISSTNPPASSISKNDTGQAAGDYDKTEQNGVRPGGPGD